MYKHYYFKDQIWDGSNGDQLKFLSLTEEEFKEHDDLVSHPFYLLPDGHPKKMSEIKDTAPKQAVKKSAKRSVKQADKNED